MILRIAGWAGVLTLLARVLEVQGMSESRRLELREETRDMFAHGFEGYMKYAYPADELRSLTCTPMHRDPNPGNFGINDVHPNASMTLLDTLSSLPAILPSAFPRALRLVATEVSFDQDVKIQVFEMTIRALGSLLSTYQYLERMSDDPAQQAQKLGLDVADIEHDGLANEVGAKGRTGWWGSVKQAAFSATSFDQDIGQGLKRYKPRLLALAFDLGERLLPAFATPTGLPYARVNLRYGVEKGESIETCTAGAGSLILEFAVLSRLTGDGRFEDLARKAYLALWNRRSAHDLLGNTIGVTHGQWLAPGMATVGAGVDSYYEYGIKAAILLNDDTYLDIFHDSYAAVQNHIRTSDGFIWRPTQFRTLQTLPSSTIDSLQAFVSGMQVLAGDLELAIQGHLVFWNLWQRYSALPESWDWQDRTIVWGGWPGRPEFIESTYYLYTATRDPFYLRVGERVLTDMKRRTRTSCGFATMRNVETGELEDRMESFVLSETLKYLYLLFNYDTDKTQRRPSNQVYTTEGHALSLDTRHLTPPSASRRQLHKGEILQCPAYVPPSMGGLVVGIAGRIDYDYARQIVVGPKYAPTEGGGQEGSLYGYCSVPEVPRYTFDIVLSPLDHAGDPPPEDHSPSQDKVYKDSQTGHFYIHQIDGLRLGVRWRHDGSGYDVSSIGPHRVRPGQQVYVTDAKMSGYLPAPSRVAHGVENPPTDIILRFSTFPDSHSSPVSSSASSPPGESAEIFLQTLASTATFGRSFASLGEYFAQGANPARLLRPWSNIDGCASFDARDCSPSGQGPVYMLDRGNCTFFDKALNALQAGAGGLIIVGYPPSSGPAGVGSGTPVPPYQLGDEGLIRPSAEGEDIKMVQLLKDAEFGVVYIEWAAGQGIMAAMGLSGAESELAEGGSDRYADTGTSAGAGNVSPRVPVGVEVLLMEDMLGRSSVPPSKGGDVKGRDAAAGGDVREGRVMVADHLVTNLRIIEHP